MIRAPLGAMGEEPGAAPLRRACALVLAILCALFALLFTGLGVWQVKRLSWKLDLIARVEARIHAAPQPAPEGATADDEYRRVVLSGHYRNDRETLVQALTELGGGFWVLTPFVTDRGFTVLVNRGFVPPDRRAPESRTAGRVEGPARVVGLLRLSEPGGGFLRANDPAADRWYSRDVAAIAGAKGLPQVAPYFIDAERRPDSEPPVGGLTVVRFSNNHLGYALTWFALAAMSLAAALALWRWRT